MSANKKTVSSVRAGDAREKPTDKLSVKEFRDRFCIPNGVIVEFLDEEEVVPTEKAEGNAIIFSKEQFNLGSVPSSCCLRNSFIFPGSHRLHPPQHSLLRIRRRRGKGIRGGPVRGRGYWSIQRHFLQTTQWCFRHEVKEADVEKRRTLLDDRERRKTRKLMECSGERSSLLPPTPPKGICSPPITHEAEVIIEEPEPCSPSISSGLGHVARPNHSGPSLSWLLFGYFGEKAASINHPGSPSRCRCLRPFVRSQWRNGA
ncbi:hypothetical protein AAG906_036870 [Vitis piasezkii]